MAWNIIDSGCSSAAENMEMDFQLLEKLPHLSAPLLHLYEWEGAAATYGYFVKPENYLQMGGVAERSLTLAKRPTGGGIIFHLTDYAFSALVPASYIHYSTNTLENYSFINGIVARVLEKFIGSSCGIKLLEGSCSAGGHASHFCMAKPTIYDVMLKDYKIGGAAQRRTKAGFLHQGSITLALPSEEFLQAVLLPGSAVLEAMRQNSCSLIDQVSAGEIAKARAALKALLIEEVGNL